jgi:hypothetical protein
MAMLHRSWLREQDKADTASPFLKGEGGVMRVLKIKVSIAKIPGMLRGRVMSYPKENNAHVEQVPTKIHIRKQTVNEE